MTAGQDGGGMSDGARSLIGIAITTGSIAMFFAWGLHFKMFGQPISLNLRTLGLFMWIPISIFGSMTSLSGFKGGLKAAGTVVLLFVAALAVGLARGVYH
jgi:hypothetical protein